jgi:hypothetical protein
MVSACRNCRLPYNIEHVYFYFQDAFPARFKGIHYINEPAVFDYIFAIAKQFMKEKTVSRVRLSYFEILNL